MLVDTDFLARQAGKNTDINRGNAEISAQPAAL